MTPQKATVARACALGLVLGLLAMPATAGARTITQDLEVAHRYWKTDICRGEWKVIPDESIRARGAPYVACGFRGFSGWTSRPAWMPGGWEFFEPYVSTGRLFMRSRGRRWGARVLLPARPVSFYRWKVKPSGRRYMREYGDPQPVAEHVTPGGPDQ